MHRGLKLTAAVLICIIWCLLSLRLALANDIQIANLTVHPHNAGTGEVEFDVTWSNSWRSTTEPYNWDAAWIFCKIRRNGGDWAHLKLNTTGHTIPSTPQAISTAIGLADTGAAHNASTNPAVGIFMYRANDGFGTFTANDVRLKWNYADNGASSSDVVDIRVFGIEMVYIPEGAFYAGGNWSAEYGFRRTETRTPGVNVDPWNISSESAITTTSGTSGDYYYPGSFAYGDAANSVFTIPANFPKGYAAFYMMKGEVSQGQYVRFFNTLTATQKTTRDITGDPGKNQDTIRYRNNISWTGSGDATLNGGTHSGVAMNYIGWTDLAALLDWAGLRPMTELEFEKSCRGPKTPFTESDFEYAWGNASFTTVTSITDDGLSSERGQSGSNVYCGNNSLNAIAGPVRVGSFAKGVNTREASGAGFYGVMELQGNVAEAAVPVANSTARAFEGRYHGNGILDASGNANVTSWPGKDNVGLRGGSFADWCYDSFSERTLAAYPLGRERFSGGRGVRTAP